MSAIRWLPFEQVALRSAGLRSADAELLAERGLPNDSNRMFVRNARRELHLQEFPRVGPAVFLGDFEDGVNSYWLSVADGSVWIKKGYEGTEGDFTRVNSSLYTFQRMLEIWEGFIFSGVQEEDDSYDALVEQVVTEAGDADPEVFEDEDSWWSRVFEEIELGSLAPE
ncbi:SUKH-4 family immunity protein [Streptomyces sp. AC555_RSS877]|uniref:SUKH-4 family immunity protein n=1 Tax=Streptomyces sp. AC555_RSS877 TaxID=2823688 RepID=UPI0027E59A92|nr:SUKH-4 family immunity protein [Streptomyces sp. AC555_RSS877]